MMSVLVITVVILCIVLVAWSRMKPHPRSPPSFPGALPIVGHSHLLVGDRKQDGKLSNDFSQEEREGVSDFYSLNPNFVPSVALSVNSLLLPGMQNTVFKYLKIFVEAESTPTWVSPKEVFDQYIKMPTNQTKVAQTLIVGDSKKYHGHFTNLNDFIRRLQVYSLEKGGVCEAWLGPHSYYVITDPEDSLTLSNTCLNKIYIYGFMNDFINNGLITAEASVWKSHRKLLNPAFSQQLLNTYLDEMNVQAQHVVSQLASEVGKGPFDVRKYFVSCTVSTVTRTSLGLNNKDHVAIDTDYADAIENLLILYSDRIHKVWLHFSYIYKWSALKCTENQLLNKMKSIIDPIIHNRKSEVKKNKDLNTHSTSTLGNYKPILDQMLHLSEEQGVFTDDDIREHLDTLVAAAYDTTSTALTFMLLVIGEKQNVQENVYNELQDVLQHDVEDITKHDLQKLVYLEAVIKETMRLYPVVPVIGRRVDTDVKLKNCTLRAGNSCLVGIYGLHRHPMWGADAEQFRPERWLDPASLPDHPSLNAGFGVGKRNCIGKQYGMTMMKMVLAHILRRYCVTASVSNVECEFDIVMKPVKGHLITLTSRT